MVRSLVRRSRLRSAEAGEDAGGNMVQGRKPNLKRWARIQRLRDAGLPLAQIGRRLGMTKKAVHRTLRTIQRARLSPRSVPCAACRRDIVSAGALASDRGSALCLECLGKQAGVSFSRRLKAFRLAAGLTKAELVLSLIHI